VEKEGQQVLFRRENQTLRSDIDAFLSDVRDELDDHREALNENTSEIESTFELFNKLNCRLDKLQERLDEITMLVKHGPAPSKKEFKISPLSRPEKEVFFALYTLTETTPFATYHQLAKKLVTTVESVARNITALISKGIPVDKKYSNGNAFLGLDKDFKQTQAKENIVKLDTKLTYWQRP